MSLSPRRAPYYRLFRNVSSVDTLPETDGKQSINMSNYKTANICVVPAGGANPTVQVLFWCEEALAFVQAQTPLTFAGVGADTPYEFSVPCNGRRMYIAVTTLSAGTVKILVSGFELSHPE